MQNAQDPQKMVCEQHLLSGLFKIVDVYDRNKPFPLRNSYITATHGTFIVGDNHLN